MAAGQGFKTFNTGDVLTANDVNGYLMQGVLVFASAAARNAAITSPQEGQFAFTKDTNGLWYYDGAAWVASGATGDIEGVTAGVGISGGGTSGTVTITNDMATTITASGDIVVGTGSGTYDNLPIGTTNQVLTADTTVSPYKVKWATPSAGGGMTLLSTTTLSGAFTSITGISQAYKHLLILVDGVNIATSAQTLKIQPNGSTTYYVGISGVSGAATTYANTNNITSTAWDYGSNNGKIAYWVYDYSAVSTPSPGHKAVSFSGVYVPGAQGYFSGGGGVPLGQEITSMYFAVSTSFNGGTVRIYGVS
jgi:hypothetical protein